MYCNADKIMAGRKTKKNEIMYNNIDTSFDKESRKYPDVYPLIYANINKAIALILIMIDHYNTKKKFNTNPGRVVCSANSEIQNNNINNVDNDSNIHKIFDLVDDCIDNIVINLIKGKYIDINNNNNIKNMIINTNDNSSQYDTPKKNNDINVPRANVNIELPRINLSISDWKNRKNMNRHEKDLIKPNINKPSQTERPIKMVVKKNLWGPDNSKIYQLNKNKIPKKNKTIKTTNPANRKNPINNNNIIKNKTKAIEYSDLKPSKIEIIVNNPIDVALVEKNEIEMVKNVAPAFPLCCIRAPKITDSIDYVKVDTSADVSLICIEKIPEIININSQINIDAAIDINLVCVERIIETDVLPPVKEDVKYYLMNNEQYLIKKERSPILKSVKRKLFILIIALILSMNNSVFPTRFNDSINLRDIEIHEQIRKYDYLYSIAPYYNTKYKEVVVKRSAKNKTNKSLRNWYFLIQAVFYLCKPVEMKLEKFKLQRMTRNNMTPIKCLESKTSSEHTSALNIIWDLIVKKM